MSALDDASSSITALANGGDGQEFADWHSAFRTTTTITSSTTSTTVMMGSPSGAFPE